MSDLELLVKNPSKNTDGDFRLRVPHSATVGEVKARLQAEYPGISDRGTITIIYAGRVLKQDEAPLSAFLHPTVDSTTPHTLHIVVKPAPGDAVGSAAAAPSAAQSQSSQQPTQASQPPPASAGASSSGAGEGAVPSSASVQLGAQPGPSSQVPGAPGAGTAPSLPAVSAPVQGYAYTIPSPYAYYNPALSAAYTAALQALQAAVPPAPPAASAGGGGADAGAAPAAAAQGATAAAGNAQAAFNAALQEMQAFNAMLQNRQATGFVASQPAAAGVATGAPAARATEGDAAPAPANAPEGIAAAAAAAGPGAGGVLAMPPIALPMAQFAYVPAFIPIPQPVLTAIPHPQAAQQAAPAAGQEQQAQPAMVQGVPPMGPFIPVGPFGQVMQQPMQVHVVEAVPGEAGGVRHRRVDVNQPGALPPEVVEALRVVQQRGQLPANLANMVAQLQRQQAARRGVRAQRRGRGFAIQINLPRINMRAVMQLLFMIMIMAPYFSMRRLVTMFGIALLINLARLDMVRRALNRMVGQLQLPLQQQGVAAGAGGGGAVPGGAGQAAAPGAAQGGFPAAGVQQREEEGGAAAAAAGAEGREGAAAAAAPREAEPPGADPAAAAGPAAGAEGAQPQRPRPGILREVQALLVGFVTSLLPGWNVNPEDAAAFAAAEEMMAQEAQEAAGR